MYPLLILNIYINDISQTSPLIGDIPYICLFNMSMGISGS